MKIKLAALSEKAIEELEGFLMRIKSGGDEDAPYHLLEGKENVAVVQLSTGEVIIDTEHRIHTRGDLGEYLSGFIDTNDDLSKLLDSKGVGSFLALAFFEAI